MTNTFQAVDTVETMIEAGASFENVEEYIEHLSMPERDKTALWLYAWGNATQSDRRRITLETVLLS